MAEVLNEKDLVERVEQANSDEPNITWTKDEEKRLVRKIDLMLLPAIWLMYLLSYMDRTKSALLPRPIPPWFSDSLRRNIGNAKLAGMTADLGMDSNQYSVSLVVFFGRYMPILCSRHHH